MKGYKIGISEIDDNDDLRFCYALIELEIPEDYPGLKCYNFESSNRSNVARVLKINKIVDAMGCLLEPIVKVTQKHLDSAFSLFNPNFCYRPGEIVYPDRFEDKMFMCANGIHFFTDREQAIQYVMNDWVVGRLVNRALEKTVLRLMAVER